ncbi:nectin-3-like protein isoform X2 [Heptranchias perlo]|uniref:nectin-3-like protein isoform X2 n=1 Tax=Heptranchias perlo TaxID=212740 RepID=UPI00355A302F
MAGTEPASPFPLLLFLLSGALAGPVVVDRKVSAILGKNATLKCLVMVKETVTQISWEKQEHGTTETVAVFNPIYGISIQGNYPGRAVFTNPSLKDATILITKVGFSDSGNYICKVATFPLGNYQETSTVTVIVEPIITVGGGPEPLVDGANETVAAVCTAANGKPEAVVFWETDLIGEQQQTKISAPNETVTVVNQFKIIPSRFVRKRPITCIVVHPPLNTSTRVPYILDVQYAPEITVMGYDGNWFVGRQNVQLKCKADANPSPSAYIWSRLEGQLPEDLQVENDTLTFNRPLNHNDSGIYVCEVVNIHGHRKKQKVVQIRVAMCLKFAQLLKKVSLLSTLAPADTGSHTCTSYHCTVSALSIRLVLDILRVHCEYKKSWKDVFGTKDVITQSSLSTQSSTQEK